MIATPTSSLRLGRSLRPGRTTLPTPEIHDRAGHETDRRPDGDPRGSDIRAEHSEEEPDAGTDDEPDRGGEVDQTALLAHVGCLPDAVGRGQRRPTEGGPTRDQGPWNPGRAGPFG